MAATASIIADITQQLDDSTRIAFASMQTRGETRKYLSLEEKETKTLIRNERRETPRLAKTKTNSLPVPRVGDVALTTEEKALSAFEEL